MYWKMCLTVATSLMLVQSAEAQLFRGRTAHGRGPVVSGPVVSGPQYYAGPGGTLYAIPVAGPSPVVHSGAVSVADPCCPCPPGPGVCHDNCTSPPQIILKPYNCPPVETCKPIDVVITPAPEPECIEIPFYGKPVTFKHKVKVPVRLIECEEVIRFKDVTINFKCCEIKVCVPCERCIVKREKCVEQDREVSVEAYRRRDGTIDVYALDVPGLPKKYVLRLKLTESEFKKDFPGNPPVYP